MLVTIRLGDGGGVEDEASGGYRDLEHASKERPQKRCASFTVGLGVTNTCTHALAHTPLAGRGTEHPSSQSTDIH